MLDDSLILGRTKGGKYETSAEKALSVSSSKLFKEDPYLFYLTKIQREKEPEKYATSFGTACHEGVAAYLEGTGSQEERIAKGLQAFRSEAAKVFPKIADPTDRYNVRDRRNGAGKQEVEITFEKFVEQGEELLSAALGMFASEWDAFSPIAAQGKGGIRTEIPLGVLAAERSMPTEEIRVFDARVSRWKTIPCAIIAGVGYHGYIDAVMEINGSPMIMDHKFVSHVVPFYSTRSGWKGFTPSYNPLTDIQLDIYSYATGITRAGFQFFTRHPQYVPNNNVLQPEWIPENTWKSLGVIGTELPMAWAKMGDELRYVSIWRPDPSDHSSRPNAWTRPLIMGRTTRFVRAVAEGLTESLLLLKDGVDPSIAFPAGNPTELSKKSCPYCVFNNGTMCPTPRDAANAEEQYRKTLQEREILCQQNKEILERRALWAAGSLVI